MVIQCPPPPMMFDLLLNKTYVDEPLNISLLEIEEHRGVVEVGQVGHVLAAVVLRWVHLPYGRIMQHF